MADPDAHQARRGVVPGEHLLRPLLWNLPVSRPIPPSEPEFHAAPDTPRANNLLSGGLLDQNPNSTQPFRLDRTCPLTSDQNHDYTPEQKAFDHGLMDGFVQNTGFRGNELAPMSRRAAA